MQTYTHYKDSGIDWIGPIPEHWEVCKNKFINKIYNGDSLNENQKKKYESEDINELPYISSKDINLDYSTINYENGLRISDSQNFKIAPISTSLICIEGGSAGRKIAFTLQNVCFVNKLACFNTYENYHSKFIYYSLKGQLFQTQFKNAMTGLIGGVSISALNNFIFTLPPIHEQEAIANFLDEKTAKIDALVQTKAQQIEKLKELRQAKIHQAVTKGLDANAPTKDSGVPWIGEIPEHWEVRRFTNSFSMSKGLTITKANLQDEGIYCLNYGEIHSKYGFEVNPEIHPLRCVDADYLKTSSSSLLEKGDFIFADTSEDLKGSGNFTYLSSNIKTFAGYHTIIAKPNKDLNSRFLAYEFDCTKFRTQIQSKVKGVKVFSITQTLLKTLFIWLPPMQEQEQIVAYLDEVTGKIDQAIAQKQEQISKLKEYKQSLINDVVTGKVKVC